MTGSRIPLDLDQIQGNIIGFNKDYQTFLFLRFPTGERAREDVLRWLRDLVPQVSTAAEVLAFNDLFAKIRKRKGREGTVTATWLNIAFTHKGLEALGTLPLDGFPGEFKAGMRDRAEEILGDVDDSAPKMWKFPEDGGPIDALLLLAADRPADLATEAERQETALKAAGIELLHRQDGMTLQGEQRGHEHFGFKDGVSQPDIRDDRITPPVPGPGTEQRVAPGEFVLGYPAENDAPTTSPPDWTRNGSYLVFRRLHQDVAGFQEFVKQEARNLKLSEELLAAKLVGRYRSGAPLARSPHPTAGTCPHTGDGSAAARVFGGSADPGFDPAHGNDFGYRDDLDGLLVPLAAHIRKINPRDQSEPGEREVRKHRILRRGIPFTEPDGERGLLFVCYQGSIANQFEFVQQMWANVATFPLARRGDPPGQDPIVGHPNGPREFDIPGCPGHRITSLSRWVTMTGGDYFFSPSLAALHLLANQPGKEGIAMTEYTKPYAGAWHPLMPEYCIMPMNLDNNDSVMALGSCTVLISVAAAAQAPDIGQIPRQLEWRVIIGDRKKSTVDEEVIWHSNDFTRLVMNAHGIALGSAQVPVRKLLEALAKVMPDKTVPQILEIINPDWIKENPDMAYRYFYVQILIGKTYVDFPIDFGPGGNPGPNP